MGESREDMFAEQSHLARLINGAEPADECCCPGGGKSTEPCNYIVRCADRSPVHKLQAALQLRVVAADVVGLHGLRGPRVSANVIVT